MTSPGISPPGVKIVPEKVPGGLGQSLRQSLGVPSPSKSPPGLPNVPGRVPPDFLPAGGRTMRRVPRESLAVPRGSGISPAESLRVSLSDGGRGADYLGSPSRSPSRRLRPASLRKWRCPSRRPSTFARCPRPVPAAAPLPHKMSCRRIYTVAARSRHSISSPLAYMYMYAVAADKWNNQQCTVCRRGGDIDVIVDYV